MTYFADLKNDFEDDLTTWENVRDILLRQQHEAISEEKNTELNICLEKDKKKHAILIVKQIVVVILFLLGILKNFHNGHIFVYKKYIFFKG